jgi:hypothetical protein
MPKAVGEGRLHVSRRQTHSNETENAQPDRASDEVRLQHFFTLRQMDAGKNSDVIDKLSRLKI